VRRLARNRSATKKVSAGSGLRMQLVCLTGTVQPPGPRSDRGDETSATITFLGESFGELEIAY
jgi:hypothetical protein